MNPDIRRIVAQHPALTLQVNRGERHRIMHAAIDRGSLWVTPKRRGYSVCPSGRDVDALMDGFLRARCGPARREYLGRREWDADHIGAVAEIIQWFASMGSPGMDFALPEEVAGSGPLVEGALRRITVNAYERNPDARRRCIEHHGSSCAACGFDFGAAYGPVARGHVHVHHLVPLASIQAEYEVDPVKDLRPVCANCHAVIHLGGVVRSIAEVRRLIEEAGGPAFSPHPVDATPRAP